MYSFYQLYLVLESGSIFRNKTANIYLGIALTFLVTQLLLAALLLFQDVGRILIGIFNVISSLFSDNSSGNGYLPTRRKFLTGTALGLAAIPFSSMIYGITKGKYHFTVERLKLAFKDLPKSFNGFKVVQISDIHAGSFDNPKEVARGVEMVNELNPDIILFTGDLVNSDQDEILPYMSIFSKLRATHGIYAVLGNHDYYGERGMNDSVREKYRKSFYQKFTDMGFQLLNNESVSIEKSNDRISILGVENWGASRWFPKHGDLDQALKNTNQDAFKILLSHDPSHWDEKVLPHKEKIQLTLSGHTHGMQFGVNLGGLKWSPIQYRYPRWMGLYKEAGQYLYVNRGFGFLGFPGRVGMWPEITLLELQSTV